LMMKILRIPQSNCFKLTRDNQRAERLNRGDIT
jgi:hypothetical protein